MRDALAAGEIDTETLEAAIPPGLRGQLAEWGNSTEGMAGIPDGALAACMVGYAQLHGTITLELIGRMPPQLSDRSALFDLGINHISASLNALPPQC